MRTTGKALVSLVVLALGLSGASTVAADETAPERGPILDPAITTRVVGLGTGERINILENDGQTITFKRNQPFYIQHGWGCYPDDPTFGICMGPGTNVFFYIVKKGESFRRLQSTYFEVPAEDLCPGCIWRQWVVEFPDGMPRNPQTFGTTWMLNRWVELTAAVTVRFVP